MTEINNQFYHLRIKLRLPLILMAGPLKGKIMNVKINLVKPQIALKTVAPEKKQQSIPSMAKGSSNQNKGQGGYSF